MVRNEILEDGRIRHYSDCGYKIQQVETNKVYEDAVDDVPCRYTYEETNELIEITDPDVPSIPIPYIEASYRSGVNDI